MNPKPTNQASEPMHNLALVALRRAGDRARQLAVQTGTALIVIRDNKIVRLDPHQEASIEKINK